MARLGYDRYVAQGGDWGSAVTTEVGAQDPEHCAAIHITLNMSGRPSGQPTEPDELHALARVEQYLKWDSGYSTQQRTRPQTLGFGLADSPAGQLAWILEKFWAWTDCDGDPEHVLTRDELLDNVMLYWVTNSATSSARLYWESFGRRITPDRDRADWIRRLSQGDRAAGQVVVERALPEHRPLARVRQGRPLRRVRGARDVRRRPARVGAARALSRSADCDEALAAIIDAVLRWISLWRSPSKYSRNAASSANSAMIEKSYVPGLMRASRPIRYDSTPSSVAT